jgi:hypothetical protein
MEQTLNRVPRSIYIGWYYGIVWRAKGYVSV